MQWEPYWKKSGTGVQNKQLMAPELRGRGGTYCVPSVWLKFVRWKLATILKDGHLDPRFRGKGVEWERSWVAWLWPPRNLRAGSKMVKTHFKAQAFQPYCLFFQERMLQSRGEGDEQQQNCFQWKSKKQRPENERNVLIPLSFLSGRGFGSKFCRAVNIQERKVTCQPSCSPSPHLDKRRLLTTWLACR